MNYYKLFSKITIKIGVTSLATIFLIFFYTCGFSQEKPKEDFATFKERIFTGGNLGLQFGSITFIDISPLVGYRINQDLSAGLGLTYRFFRDAKTDFSSSIYGARVFARYTIWRNIFAHGEYEVLNGEWTRGQRGLTENALVGAGYYSAITDKIGLNLMVLWNFNLSGVPLYTNPVIRGGVNIGL